MSDVFISYSRKDRAFVGQLNARLTGAGREVWVDLEGIAPSADWLAEIKLAIERADAFLFVLTPDSLASKVCGEELAYAVELNKRLIPVVHRDVPTAGVPPALAALNWIFFRSTDDADAANAALQAALDLDLGWAQQHTRLLNRALDWERRGQHGSFLLRGRDLSEAEDALAGLAEGKQPEPTPLQRRYVLASRRDADRGQRIRVAALTATLVVVAALAAVAWSMRNVAVAQTEIAEHERVVAVARQLTAQAQLLTLQQPARLTRAALLAAEGLRRDPSLESEQALRNAAALLPKLDSTRPLTGTVAQAVFNLDSPTMVVTGFGDDPAARVYDAASGQLRGTLAHGGHVNAVAIGANGRFLVTGSDDRLVRLWDGSRLQELMRLTLPAPVQTVAMSPSAALVAAAGYQQGPGFLPLPQLDTAVRLWDIRNRREYKLEHGSTVLALAFSPDGKLLVSAGGTTEDDDDLAMLDGAGGGLAIVWDANTRRPLRRLEHGQAVRAVDFSPDSRLIATASADGSARLWDAASGRELRRYFHATPVEQVRFSRDGKLLATVGEDGVVQLWQVAQNRLVAQLVHGQSVNDVAFSADGRYLATAVGSVGRIWDTANGREAARIAHTGDVRGLAFAAEGHALSTVGTDLAFNTWNVDASGRENRRIRLDGWVHALAFGPTSRVVAGWGPDAKAYLWDAVSARLIGTLSHAGTISSETPSRSVRDASLSPDGTLAATASDDRTAGLWEVGTGKRIAELAHGDRLQRARFTPDGARLVTFGVAGRFVVWEAPSGRELLRSDPFDVVAVSPDATRAAGFAKGAGSVRLWDTTTGAALDPAPTEADVTALEWSADGRFLAITADKSVRVWDAAERKPAFAVSDDDRVTGVRLDRAGRYLVTLTQAPSVTVWETATGRNALRVKPAGKQVSLSLSYMASDVPTRVTYVAPEPRVMVSDDGRYLLVGTEDQRAVTVWDLPAGREVGRLRHEDLLVSVAFSPDGRFAATASVDRTARVWDLANAREVARLKHDDGIFTVAFAPDGRQLATAAADGTLQFWLWRPADLVDDACARLSRNLSAAEWRDYLGDEPPHKTCENLP